MLKKTLSLAVKEFKDIDENFFMFEGLAATFGNVDQGNDRILKGAFKKSLQEIHKKAKPTKNTDHKKLFPVLLQHDHRKPIGIFIEAKETDEGLYVKGILPRDDTFVSGQVIPQVKLGSLSDMSIGYMVNEAKFVDGGVRELEELTLFETSLVTIPMNDQAVVTGFKSVPPYQDLPIAERDTAWDSVGAIERVKEFTGSTDEPNKAYKSCFLYCDSEKEGEFGAYKLPITDVIEGKLCVIPRAIFEATAALSGAHGALDLPKESKENITSNIDKYYKKMDLESPSERKYLLGKTEAAELTPRQFERILIEQKLFSKEGATLMASNYKGVNRDDDSTPLERDALAPGFFGNFAKELNEINKSIQEKQNVR